MNSNLVVNWVNILQAAPACVPLTGIGIGVICIWFGGWLRWDRWKYKIQDLTTIKSKWSVKQAQGLVFSSHLLWSGAKLWLLFSCPSSFPSCRFLAFWWLWGLLALCSSFCPSFSSCLHQVPSSPGLKYLEKRGKKEAAEREREVFQSPLLTVLWQNLLKWKHIPPCIQKLKTQLVLLWGLGLRLCNYFFTASHCSVSKESPDCQLHFSGCLKSISISFWLFLKSCGTFMETMFLSFH